MGNSTDLQALIEKYNRELMQMHSRSNPPPTAPAPTTSSAPVASPEPTASELAPLSDPLPDSEELARALEPIPEPVTPVEDLLYVDELPPLPLSEDEPVRFRSLPPDDADSFAYAEDKQPEADNPFITDGIIPPVSMPFAEAEQMASSPPPPPPFSPMAEATLQFHVTAAETALSVAGVYIEVFRREDFDMLAGAPADDGNSAGNDVITEMVKTDDEGYSPIMTLPAVQDVATLDSDANRPHTVYQATLVKAGYFRVHIHCIPLFGGMRATQPVEMIPLPDTWDGGDIVDIEQVTPQVIPQEISQEMP